MYAATPKDESNAADGRFSSACESLSIVRQIVDRRLCSQFGIEGIAPPECDQLRNLAVGITQVPEVPCICDARGHASRIQSFLDPFQAEIALLHGAFLVLLLALLFDRESQIPSHRA